MMIHYSGLKGLTAEKADDSMIKKNSIRKPV